MKRLANAVSVMFLAAVIAGSIPLLSGCGGGGATYHVSGNKTLGTELQDLQQSYEKGAITEKQYEDAKKQLIKKYTR